MKNVILVVLHAVGHPLTNVYPAQKEHTETILQRKMGLAFVLKVTMRTSLKFVNNVTTLAYPVSAQKKTNVFPAQNSKMFITEKIW